MKEWKSTRSEYNIIGKRSWILVDKEVYKDKENNLFLKSLVLDTSDDDPIEDRRKSLISLLYIHTNDWLRMCV